MPTVTIVAVERLAQLFVVLATALAVVAAATRRARHRRALRRLAAERAVRPVLLELLGDGNDPGATLPAELDRTFDDLALNLAGKLRGSDRAALVGLLRRRGVLDRALRGTRSWNSVRRLRSVELLGQLGLPDSLPALTVRLHDRAVDVRRAAVRAVGRIPDAEGADALLTLLDASARRVPEHCITLALLRGGRTAVPPLVQALTHGGPRARLAAAQVLGWLGELDAVDPLIAMLDDDDPPLRLAAVEALGRIGAPAGAGALRALLTADEPEAVRRTAAIAVGRLGDPVAAEALTGLLAESHPLALAAARALHQLGPAGRDTLTGLAATVPEARDVLRLPIEGPADTHIPAETVEVGQ